MTEKIRLLIVDDHPVVRDGLRGVFDGRAGHRMWWARPGNGAEALDRVDAAGPTSS